MIKPIGVRKVAVVEVGNRDKQGFGNVEAGWRAYRATAKRFGTILPETIQYPVSVDTPEGEATFNVVIEEYDLREPLAEVRIANGTAESYPLRDGRHIVEAVCRQMRLGEPDFSKGTVDLLILSYREVPAPAVEVGVLVVDGEVIGCTNAAEARRRTNECLTSLRLPPIDFSKVKLPYEAVILRGLCRILYYETTTDQLEIPTVPPVKAELSSPPPHPGVTQWTWTGQGGAEKYGKTRADFPTPFGFIRAERNLISGVESYELLKGKFVHVQPPQGHRYNVTVKEDGKVVEERQNLSRREIADDYYPDNGDESLLMEFREDEDGSQFAAKIRPDAPGAKAFRLYAVLVK